MADAPLLAAVVPEYWPVYSPISVVISGESHGGIGLLARGILPSGCGGTYPASACRATCSRRRLSEHVADHAGQAGEGARLKAELASAIAALGSADGVRLAALVIRGSDSFDDGLGVDPRPSGLRKICSTVREISRCTVEAKKPSECRLFTAAAAVIRAMPWLCSLPPCSID
jgi:hypothetical protein